MNVFNRTFASVGPSGITHYARCWPCICGQCLGGDHPWADDDDIAHALKIGKPESALGRCGCLCADGPEITATDDEVAEAYAEYQSFVPCPTCGSFTACGYDGEGRPMIHTIDEDES